MIKVIKKDGYKEDFNPEKIHRAVKKSADRSLTTLKQEDYATISNMVERYLIGNMMSEVKVEQLHNIVEACVNTVNVDVSDSYKQYRNYKQDFAQILDGVYQEVQKIMYIGDKENSNTDSALVSTKRSLIYNQLNKELYKKFFLKLDEVQACKDGYIYIHDMVSRRDTMNCCLMNVKNILVGGFEMGNIWYNEPKTLDVAFDVIGDIVLSSASQQYGGYTIPEIDTLLSPYAEKSYEKYLEKYLGLGLEKSKAEKVSLEDVETDFRQGFQGWEYKFNTVSSSRGDFPQLKGGIMLKGMIANMVNLEI